MEARRLVGVPRRSAQGLPARAVAAQRLLVVSMIEIWKEIPGFLGYEASTLGRIKGPRGLLTLHATKGGYLTCSVRQGGRKLTTTVQRLVLQAFAGEPPTDRHEANHVDGQKQNNTPENLEWVTPAQNKAHARDVLQAAIGRKRKPRPADERAPIPFDLRGAGWRSVTLHPIRGTKWQMVDNESGQVLSTAALKTLLHEIADELPRTLSPSRGL